jgi:uncharacterized protein (TIGR00730 family)
MAVAVLSLARMLKKKKRAPAMERVTAPPLVLPEKNEQDDVPQPSWTGVRSDRPRSASQERLKHWLCNADSKCTPIQESDFTENINWRIFRIMAEFVEGFDFLSRLTKEVSVFGSARLSSGNRYYQMAKDLGILCGKAGYTMVTGGGPGIMEAANWGAHEAGGESVGLDISLPMEQRRNQYVKRGIGFHYFFTRKVMLSASAQAYVFFPGGFGTFDELFEMVTLIQTGRMSNQVPVILVGKTFWEPFLGWMKQAMYEENRFVDRDDLRLFQLVDSAAEAFAIIKKTRERML